MLKKEYEPREFIAKNGERSKYRFPIQKTANEWVRVKLFCERRGCKKFIKGLMGYNGSFHALNGSYQCDLRDQVFVCRKHLKKESKHIIVEEQLFKKDKNDSIHSSR